MAAESLARAGVQVDLYDAMPSVGRKFLQAGVGGLNLTHSEPIESFLLRYGPRRHALEPALTAFGPAALREWAEALGVTTFVGSSGRIFPKEMKAAPLLRAWQKRLRDAGIRFHLRHRWLGWNQENALRFATPEGESTADVDATVLALGGGSWTKLGSDGAWVPLLAERGVQLSTLMPANCGFDTNWSEHFRERYAGAPVKSVVAESGGERQQGEFIVSAAGVEGGLIYALSASLRDSITRHGKAVLHLDLTPGRELARLTADLAKPRGSQSMANHIRKQTGLDGVKAGFLRELAPKEVFDDPALLAQAIKQLPLKLTATRPIDEAISTAGGVSFESLDEQLMLRGLPGVFCAGEMLDWEAPTGGYLLTACFATGHEAGTGAAAWLRSRA
jgi:uncharacterized flavoprotein (TIGR03862 family)